MSKCFTYFLLLLSILLVRGSPLNSTEEIAKEKKDELLYGPKIYRLPDDVIPISYILNIVPDLTTFTFSGKVEITVAVKNSTNKIELHGKKLTITDSRVIRGKQLINSECKLDELNELIVVQTSQQLNSEVEYNVSFEFKGLLTNDLVGFYSSSYVVNDTKYLLAATKFEPDYAREAFPCFDEPRFRAKFSISIAHFPHQKATSNMPVESAPTNKNHNIGDRVWTKFQQTPLMPTYLAAFMVSEFQFISSENKKISVWTRQNAIKYASYSLKQTIKLLKALENYTGIPYTLPKLDVIAIPKFRSGAMENWGMTTYRENHVIIDEPRSATGHKDKLTRITGHELAHQWFGNLVTPLWWNYVWLSESFATYFEYFATSIAEPKWRLSDVFVVEELQNALLNEVYFHRGMTASVKNKFQIQNMFDEVSYSKGASIIRMLEHMVTPEVFKAALRIYLHDGAENYKGTVSPDLLFKAFDDQITTDNATLPTGVSISQIMKTWTENVGFPLLTVNRNYDTGKVEIKQVAYEFSAQTRLSEQKWIVPLTYTTKSEPQFSDTKPSLWSFAEKLTELPKKAASKDWVLFNLQQTGYYRVNYDHNNWLLLIDQLNENHKEIHVLNRAQLIDDAFALHKEGKIDQRIPFKLVQYLSKETDMIPWYPAIRCFDDLYYEHEHSSYENIIREFILNIVKPAYMNFGFGIKPTDDHLEKFVKPKILSLVCKLGLKSCIRNALKEYENKKNDLSEVHPDLKDLVFCEALRHSEDPQSVFNNLWSTYLKSEIDYDKNTILSSLECATDRNVRETIFLKFNTPRNDEEEMAASRIRNRVPTSTTTAYIQFLIDKVSATKDSNDEDISTVGLTLQTLKYDVKIDRQINLLKELESKLRGLYQEKYDGLIKLTRSVQARGTEKIKYANEKAEKLFTILREFLPSSETSTTHQTLGSDS